MASEKVPFLSFSTRFKPRTHASITLASRIPLSKRDCNHRYHRCLVCRCYYYYYYYHLLCCMHAIGRLPLSLQRSSCNCSRRATETRAWRNRLLESSDQGRLNASNRGIRVSFVFFWSNRICEASELVFSSHVCLIILQFPCTFTFYLEILHIMFNV